MNKAKQAIIDEINGMENRNDYFYIAGLVNMASLCGAITAVESIELVEEAGKKLVEIESRGA